MENVILIAGLGNPGARYANSRHNMGFKTVDYLSQKYGVKVSKAKCSALIGHGKIAGRKVVLAKPQTFMNNSGESLRDLVAAFKVQLSDLIIIYDDIDLDTGNIRIRKRGGAGTHNGMRSVLCHLENEEFPRVRIGIGKPPEGVDVADYVLSDFNGDEIKPMFDAVVKSADAIAAILETGIDPAMNKYNSDNS